MIDQVASNLHGHFAGDGPEDMPRRYQSALAACSRILLQGTETPEQREELLNRALSALRDVVNAGRAHITQDFIDENGERCLRLYAEACADDVKSHLLNPSNQHVPWTFLGLQIRQVLAGGSLVGGPTAEILASNWTSVETFHQQANPLLSLLLLPLFVEDTFWGMVGFDDVTRPRRWNADEIMVLRVASEMFSSTLHRWELEERLRLQVAREATLAERQRLAQELHDVITQTLYGITLMARTGRESLREGNMAVLTESLEGIEENALLAQREMRMLLYQLGPLALPSQDGLETVLKDRLRRVERRLGLETELHIDPTITLEDGAVELLYYVITEALNNSLQHAAATCVAVSLERSGDKILLHINDNGRGFRSDRLEPGMGLAQIARSARALNADLAIDATPGKGTQITLLFPPDVGRR